MCGQSQVLQFVQRGITKSRSTHQLFILLHSLVLLLSLAHFFFSQKSIEAELLTKIYLVFLDLSPFSLRLLARLMTAKFLHTEIREKGGAYGGGAHISHNGIFNFYSYR